MNIFKKIKSLLSPKDKPLELEEKSPAEQLLESNTVWPFKISGTLSIIDAGSVDEDDFPHWTIGEFDIENVEGSILVEFKGDTLKNVGITDEFEFENPLTILVKPSIEEYYQVESIEN